MDGLKFNFDGFYVKKKPKDVALELREQARETVPLYPENVSIEGGTMDADLHSDALGASSEQNDHPSVANQAVTAYSSDNEEEQTADGNVHHSTDDGIFSLNHTFIFLYYFMLIYILFCIIGSDFCGAHPQDGDDLFDINDDDDHDFMSVGDKRVGEGLISPPSKRQRIGTSSLGFASFSENARGLASFSTCPVIETDFSSSLPLITSSAANESTLSPVFPTGFPTAPTLVSPSGDVMPLMNAHLNLLQEAVGSLEESSDSIPPFLPARAGSAPIPSLANDFAKGFGSFWFAPRATVRFKDSGEEPALARSIIENAIPPMQMAIRHSKTFSELAEEYDLRAYQAVSLGSLLRQRGTFEIDGLTIRVNELESKLAASQSRVENLSMELEQETLTSTSLREEKKEVVEKCLSLQNQLDTVTKEREDRDDTITQLETSLNSVNVNLTHKNKELVEAQSSFQRQFDDLKADLNAEVSREKELRSKATDRVKELESALAIKDSLLSSFSETFRRVLDHPDVKGPFSAFNDAAIVFGQHHGVLNEIKTDPTLAQRAFETLHDLGEAWNRKEFPVVNQVASTFLL